MMILHVIILLLSLFYFFEFYPSFSLNPSRANTCASPHSAAHVLPTNCLHTALKKRSLITPVPRRQTPQNKNQAITLPKALISTGSKCPKLLSLEPVSALYFEN